MIDDPTRLNKRGALLCDGDTHHLAPGEVICVRSRSNAPPHSHTAALINSEYPP